jgi:hypothetical protein
MQAISSDFLAIDRKERLHYPYFDLDHRPAEQRICDFDEVVISLDPERAMQEASR